MRRVFLYGRLADLFGRTFHMDVETPADVIRALNANFPGRFAEALKQGSYRLVRGRKNSGMHFGLEEINFRMGSADFHIIPHVEGRARGRGKGGGLLKIVLGVALVGLAIFSAGSLAGLAAPIMGGALGGLTYGNLAIMGLALALSGVAQLMSPKEKPKQETQRSQSFTFSGPRNAQEQGGPVPLIYGRVITGSIPISAGFDVEQISLAEALST